MPITPVILSGGGGTRLWPLSTPDMPKQFLALTGALTMFQMTLQRVADRDRFNPPIIVAGAAHAALVDAQLAAIGIDDATIILEPCARNTAPAIALAALAVGDSTAPLLVMPSDHVITDVTAFHAAIASLASLVQDGWLATFGITPTGPETGYGYIKLGEPQSDTVSSVARFIEKPDTASAEAMLASGDHVWNSGIFLFRPDIYLGAMAVHAPEILAAAQASFRALSTHGNRLFPQESAFAASPSDSIDYAVMEKSDRVAVARVSMGWSDIGSWDALHELGAKDENGNTTHGPARLSQSTGNLIHADGIRVSVHGVDDLIVVANGKEVMILPRGTSQKVRDFAKD